MKAFFVISVLCLGWCAVAAPMTISPKFKKVVVRTADGKVEIKGTWVAFKDVRVKARHRYRVTVRARVKEGPSLETQPAMLEPLGQNLWALKRLAWKLPAITFEYRAGADPANNKEGKFLWALYHGPAVPVYSNQFRDYQIEFYAFDTATAVRFFIRANAPENMVEVASAEIVELDPKKEQYLNANPDLKFGPFNPSGWGYAHNGIFGSDDLGPFIDLGTSWAIGDAIPVKSGDRLKFSYKGEPAAGRPNMRFGVTFLKTPQFASPKSPDRVGTNKLPMHVTKSQPEGSIELVVPPDAAWMRLTFSSGCMRYFKVEKVQGVQPK